MQYSTVRTKLTLALPFSNPEEHARKKKRTLQFQGVSLLIVMVIVMIVIRFFIELNVFGQRIWVSLR